MNVEVIRTNGARETYDIPKSRPLDRIYQLIGCDTIDTVNLRAGRVMLVDDHGYDTKTVDHGNGHIQVVPIAARKPVNPVATKMYHAVCPGTTHQIVGDVAVVRDKDFA